MHNPFNGARKKEFESTLYSRPLCKQMSKRRKCIFL